MSFKAVELLCLYRVLYVRTYSTSSDMGTWLVYTWYDVVRYYDYISERGSSRLAFRYDAQTPIHGPAAAEPNMRTANSSPLRPPPEPGMYYCEFVNGKSEAGSPGQPTTTNTVSQGAVYTTLTGAGQGTQGLPVLRIPVHDGTRHRPLAPSSLPTDRRPSSWIEPRDALHVAMRAEASLAGAPATCLHLLGTSISGGDGKDSLRPWRHRRPPIMERRTEACMVQVGWLVAVAPLRR